MEFTNLPPEMIDKICNKMETSDLLRLSQTSSEIGEICAREIRKRKYENTEFLIKWGQDSYFRKPIDGKVDYVSVTVSHGFIDSNMNVTQYGSEAPPILSNMKKDPLAYRIGMRERNIDPIIKQLAKNLVDRGYTRFRM